MSKNENGEIKITRYHRGHGAYHDGTDPIRYVDTKEPVSIERECVRCGEMPTKEGHDACLSNLPGVLAACCGHGAGNGIRHGWGAGYILFENGMVIGGHFDVDMTLKEAEDKILTFLEGCDEDEDVSSHLIAEKFDINLRMVKFILDGLVNEGILFQYKGYVLLNEDAQKLFKDLNLRKLV